MKKNIFFVFCLALMAGGTAVKAQEIIAVAGGGIFRAEGLTGDYEFAEARAMFGKNIRIGPMGGITWCYLHDGNYFYKGRIGTIGLSFDNWAQGQWNRYVWLNAGYRHTYDRGATNTFATWQRDNLISLQTGMRFSRDISERAWFSNTLIIIDGQFGIKSGEAIIQLSGEDFKALDPYKKGGVRITYENGIKQIPLRRIKNSEADFEPLIHLGYGYEAGSGNNYLEYGLGLGFGLFRDWYHDLFKVKAFMRHDLGNYTMGEGQIGTSNRLQVEVVCNLLNLSFRKNEAKKETKK